MRRSMVDSTPPQRNMKSIDLLFTSDSFEHNACDVSVANLQSQYTFLYITPACKEKEKREKEIPVIPDRELRSTVSFVSERSGWLFCLLPHGSDAVEGEGYRWWGSDGERLEPERGSLWQGETQAGVRKMRARQGHDPMSFTHEDRFSCLWISQTRETHAMIPNPSPHCLLNT